MTVSDRVKRFNWSKRLQLPCSTHESVHRHITEQAGHASTEAATPGGSEPRALPPAACRADGHRAQHGPPQGAQQHRETNHTPGAPLLLLASNLIYITQSQSTSSSARQSFPSSRGSATPLKWELNHSFRIKQSLSRCQKAPSERAKRRGPVPRASRTLSTAFTDRAASTQPHTLPWRKGPRAPSHAEHRAHTVLQLALQLLTGNLHAKRSSTRVT